MTTENQGWQFADAWVLTAVAISGDSGCDLTDLVAAADGINHAILTADEVSQGVGRLEASGLMTVSGTCFALTSDGRALVARRTGGLFGQVRLVEALLRRHDLVDRRWRVPEGALDAAVDAYQRGWRKADRGR